MLLVFVILPVCHGRRGFSDSVSHSLPLFPHFHHSQLTPLPEICFSSFLLSPNLFLTQSAVLLSGSELETVEGPPDVPRFHRDEDPTLGIRAQQEEAIADGQREKQSHERPEEVMKHLPLKVQQSSSVPLTCHHVDLDVSVHKYTYIH